MSRRVKYAGSLAMAALFAQHCGSEFLPSSEASQHVKVYQAGQEVTAPDLLPVAPTPLPPVKCKDKFAPKPVLAFLVDSEGLPRNIQFLHPAGTDLDEFALRLLNTDRFKPGTLNGTPVAVWRTVEIEIQGCYSKDGAPKGMQTAHLLSQPVQKFNTLHGAASEATLTPATDPGRTSSDATQKIERSGPGVTLPVLLNHVEAEFSEDARRANYGGTCVLSLVVDTNGMPRNIQVIRHLQHGLDEQAISAVSRYRFKPAMKQGEPVAIQLSFEVSFTSF